MLILVLWFTSNNMFELTKHQPKPVTVMSVTVQKGGTDLMKKSQKTLKQRMNPLPDSSPEEIPPPYVIMPTALPVDQLLEEAGSTRSEEEDNLSSPESGGSEGASAAAAVRYGLRSQGPAITTPLMLLVAMVPSMDGNPPTRT